MLLIKVKYCLILLAKKSFSVRLYFTVYVEETLRPNRSDVKENTIPLFVFLTLYYPPLKCSLQGGPPWTSPWSSNRTPRQGWRSTRKCHPSAFTAAGMVANRRQKRTQERCTPDNCTSFLGLILGLILLLQTLPFQEQRQSHHPYHSTDIPPAVRRR